MTSRRRAAGFDDLWIGHKMNTIPDFDHDGDVDQADFGHFQACVSEANVAYEFSCAE